MKTLTESTDNKLSGRTAAFFIFLCSMVYFTSYITRVNYGAVIIEIISAENITKQSAGTVSTAAFLTYGIGQLISGYVGDRLPPRSLITFGLFATSVCNALMPFTNGSQIMILLWAINGFFQALFWPPLVKLMASALNSDDYNRACVSVSVASSIATIAIYLSAPIVIALAGWKMVFYISAGFGVIAATVWKFASPRSNPLPGSGINISKSTSSVKHNSTANIAAILAPLAFVIVMQGILRDGLTTWMPTYISETFDFSSSASIFTGIALPVFSMISYNAASQLNKKFSNEILCASLMFALGACACAAMIFFGSKALVSVILMSVITGCMHGVNLMIISRVPAYFAKYGRISTVSGFLNAFTYLGSGISGFGIALLSEQFGWQFTIISWFLVAVAGTIVCILCINKWKNFIKE
jgi:sugar phosphate permease